MEREDGYIARIVQATRDAGIFDSTTVFLVSDHGFASINRRFEPNVVLARAKLIAVDSAGRAVSWKAAAWDADGSCAIVLNDPEDKALAKQVTAIFSKIANRDSPPISRVIERKELDRLGAIPQACIMLEASPGYYFDDAYTGSEVREAEKDYRGTHGYLPSKLEMRSALIIYGQAARVGSKAAVARMIDIAPTAGAILGIGLPDAQGQALIGLIKPQYMPPPDPDRKHKGNKKEMANRKPA
jgi:predicted AlkP superfamily pyrophosphatase or phosphodiesterase